MNPRSLRRRSTGFTIVEVVVVLAITGILAAIAAPNMANMIRVQRLKTSTFDIYSSLNLARSEAIKRNKRVRIIPTAGQWKDGWQIVDVNNNKIQDTGALSDITVSGPVLVMFTAQGRLESPIPTAISLTAPGVNAVHHRCVTVDASGRAVSREGAC